MSYHLIEAVEQLGQPQILLIGDLILDHYIWGEAERISQEAPVILLREERDEYRLGGAANVANMLRGLEADVTIAGVVGNDHGGQQMRAELESRGIHCDGLIVDAHRPTTVKQRYLGRAQHRHPHQMLRVDREVRTALGQSLSEQLLQSIQEKLAICDAVLISDYAKGVCVPAIISEVVRQAKAAGKPVIIDPASSGDYRNYANATTITPNRLETERATGLMINHVEAAFRAGEKLLQKLQLEFALVTLDSDGIALIQPDAEPQLVPTRKREVCDITGAGDMVLAMIGVGAAAGMAPVDLARLANVAGGLEVEQIGVVCISREEIISDLMVTGRSSQEKIGSWDSVAHHISARKKLGQRIVFTNGCFDVLHVGHVSYLQEAAQQGDCLVVALNSDESVRNLQKGDDRPIFSQEHRAVMLAAMECVDHVVVFDEATPHNVLERLKPDLLVKGGTYSEEEIVGRDMVIGYGGQVKALGQIPGISTTEILKQLRNQTTTPIPPALYEKRKAG